jgi:hypothetical protein
MPATPTPSASALSTTITAQELVRAGAEVADELQDTNTPVEVDCTRFLTMVNNLRAEVGEDVLASFVRVVASLYPPTTESPEVQFTPADIIRAGREYEEEKYAHGCYSYVPNYTPHPAFDRFEMMALDPLAEDPHVTQAIKDELANQEISRPWDGDVYWYMYRSFMDTWDELQCSRVEEQDNRLAWRDDDDELSVLSYISADHATLESLPGLPVSLNPCSATPSPDDLLFTPRELLDAGIALDAEMQANNCDAANPTYTPHPAFDAFMEMWRQLRSAGEYALMFIYGELGQPGMVEWVSLARTYRWHVHITSSARRCSSALSGLSIPSLSPALRLWTGTQLLILLMRSSGLTSRLLLPKTCGVLSATPISTTSCWVRRVCQWMILLSRHLAVGKSLVGTVLSSLC